MSPLRVRDKATNRKLQQPRFQFLPIEWVTTEPKETEVDCSPEDFEDFPPARKVKKGMTGFRALEVYDLRAHGL